MPIMVADSLIDTVNGAEMWTAGPVGRTGSRVIKAGCKLNRCLILRDKQYCIRVRVRTSLRSPLQPGTRALAPLPVHVQEGRTLRVPPI